jgi:hypothetical protein
MDLEEREIDLVAAITLKLDCAFFATCPKDDVMSALGKQMCKGCPPSTGSDDGCAHDGAKKIVLLDLGE